MIQHRGFHRTDPDGLTWSERAVVDLERAGESRDSIAAALGMAKGTVCIHLFRAKAKGVALRTPMLSHAEKMRIERGSDGMTARTREVATMLLAGSTLEDVAKAIGITVARARDHRRRARAVGVVFPSAVGEASWVEAEASVTKADPPTANGDSRRRAFARRWQLARLTAEEEEMEAAGRCPRCQILMPCFDCPRGSVDRYATARTGGPGGLP